jgi:hypothetical protein
MDRPVFNLRPAILLVSKQISAEVQDPLSILKRHYWHGKHCSFPHRVRSFAGRYCSEVVLERLELKGKPVLLGRIRRTTVTIRTE